MWVGLQYVIVVFPGHNTFSGLGPIYFDCYR